MGNLDLKVLHSDDAQPQAQPTPKTVTITASSICLSEADSASTELKSTNRYMALSMRMFSTRPNRNGVAVTEAFIDEIVANKEDYVCMPLCADAKKLRSKQYRGLTHMYDREKRIFLSDRIGGFNDFVKTEDEYGVSLIGYARVDKRDALVCEALEELYAEGALNFSFEILAGELREEDGVTIVDASDRNELTAMAVVSVPAYPESKALDLVAEAEPKIDEETFFENAKYADANAVLSAELDVETVRRKFFESLAHYGETLECEELFWNLRVLLFGVDFAILYDAFEGSSYKAEYAVDGDDVVITGFYKIAFVKEDGAGSVSVFAEEETASEGSETEKMDKDNEKMEAEVIETAEAIKEETVETEPTVEVAEEIVAEETTGEEPAVEEVSEVVAEEVSEEATEEIVEEVSEESSGEDGEKAEVAEVVKKETDDDDDDLPGDDDDPDDILQQEYRESQNRVAELEARCKELEAKVAELEVFKAELDQIHAEREAAEMEAKRNELRTFAAEEGLDVEDEVIAEAIQSMNHEKLMAEVIAKKNANKGVAKRETVVTIASYSDINVGNGRNWLLERKSAK